MIETIYIVRHAFRSNFSVDPKTGIYTHGPIKSPTGIPSDPPLTAHGLDQSLELAKHIQALIPPVDVVYSSPFYRCLQTLKATTDALFSEGRLKGRKIRVERGFGEFFGLAHFDHPTPPTVAILNSHFPSIDQDYISVCIPESNGELIRDLHERVKETLDSVISALDSDPAQPKAVLICSHAATLIAAGRALTGDMPDDPDTDDFQCYTAGLSRFERKSSGADTKAVLGHWRCVQNSDTSFLSSGPERGWKFDGEESFIAFPGTDSAGGTQSPKL